MNFKEFALDMYPFWIVGIFIIGAVLSTSKKELLRIDKKVLIDWARFLVIVMLIRFVICKLFLGPQATHLVKGALSIPFGVGLTVFWEDAVHGLPLLILRQLIGVNKWTKPLHSILMFLFMVEFGIGHLYQGLVPAMLLSLYIPFSIRSAKKHGFGTVMVGHMMYDISTMIFIRYIIGL